MKRKQKYIVEDQYNNLVGIFKTMEEAKAYVGKEVAYVREEYTHEPEAKSGIPQTDFLEDSWVEDDKDSSAGEIERRKKFGDRARSLLAGFSKVVPILNRIHNSGMKYGRKFHGESEEK